MASSSSVIQFPRLTSSPDIWNTTPDEFLYLPARPQNVRDGRKLKQSKSAESLTQRKDRVEFLRRREWTRRVSYGGDQPTSIPKRARTYSWEDIIAAADAAAASWDYPQTQAAAGYARRPDTIDELDESDEPYVIYTATPRPQAPSAYTPQSSGDVLYSTSPSHSPSRSPNLSPVPSTSPVRDLSPPSVGNNPYFSRRGWRGPHSRHSSLSSISEEDEGLARF
ncbi:hypothetical protein TRAPUB_5066 [Trametes pubescens]|uniref:Uncharacterized protein n=1 Tax=Trametes pubescens TaxID=154538 RepID=A0A1M2W760_TRAPU|nr:hypothetical protein TRAPUB_5066 [Trametes pubescens]